MPHLPTIPNTYRVTLKFNSFAGCSPRNVIHLEAAAGGTTPADVAAAILAADAPDMVGAVSSHFGVTDFEILPLDGTSSTSTHSTSSAANWQGATGGDYEPALAHLLTFQTGLRGRDKRGRIYLGPVAEGAISEGLIDSSTNDEVVGAWTTMLNALIAGTPSFALVVASYKHAAVAQVTNVRGNIVAGTMRRRQDQLR